MTRLYCDGPTLIRAVASAVANLEKHVDEVDSLNVFPVPDGDTGSNMLATMRASLAEAHKLPQSQQNLRNVAAALSRGALTGARGNSGVILSQIIQGMTDGADGRRRASGLDLARGLRRGSDVAYRSVLTPVEGTILTVIRDAAEAAESAAGRQPHVESVLSHTIEAAALSVQRTPSLLPVLEDAGVVDSGGQGLFRLLEGTMQIDAAETPVTAAAIVAPLASTASPVGAPAGGAASAAPSLVDHEPESPLIEGHDEHGHPRHGYETEYVLSADARELHIETIRAALQDIGDSIIVAGDERLARVHIHGLRPDLALGIGVDWGRLSQVSVKDLDQQIAERSEAHTAAGASAPAALAGIALLAVADADGLAATLQGLGARMVRPEHGSRPSVGEIADGILAAGASEVIVLPNDRDAHLAADQAASLTPEVEVSVIPTRNAAEGVAAALAFDAEAALARNTEIMQAEAGSLRSFSVITAARDSLVDGVAVRSGQILALDADRQLLASGDTVEDTTLRALAAIGDFELVTCYRGSALEVEQADRLAERIAEQAPAAEVEIIAGGQRHDHLLIAVE
ncbi:MAG: DAK2 domain-containing protein [Chloroflexota bacterium]